MEVRWCRTHALRIMNYCTLCNYTPGRGKIVPRNIMFEYLGFAYRDSDYTAMIAIKH